MENLMNINDSTSTERLHRPQLHYAMLKFVHWPIIGLLVRLGVPYIPVSGLGDNWALSFLATIGFVLTLLIYAYKVIYLYNTRYLFKDEHLEITKGVFSIENDYVQYYRIKDLKRFRSFSSRLIGTMDLILITSDKFNRRISLDGISNDKGFPNQLREMVERERRTKGVYEVD